jgi:hypothetical protein
MPARPFLKFLLLYVGKRGFLDGTEGFHYAVLQSLYEYMIVLKTKELIRKQAVAFAAGKISPSPSAASIEKLHANSRTSE